MPVTAEFTGLITIFPRTLYLGRVLPGAVVKRDIHIISNIGEPVEIVEISSGDGLITLKETSPNKKGDQITLSFAIQVPNDAQGLLRGKTSVVCKTSEEFKTEIPLFAIIALQEAD